MWFWTLMVVVVFTLIASIHSRFGARPFRASILCFCGIAANSAVLALWSAVPADQQVFGWYDIVLWTIFVFFEFGFIYMFYCSVSEIYQTRKKLLRIIGGLQSDIKDLRKKRPRYHLGEHLDD